MEEREEEGDFLVGFAHHKSSTLFRKKKFLFLFKNRSYSPFLLSIRNSCCSIFFRSFARKKYCCWKMFPFSPPLFPDTHCPTFSHPRSGGEWREDIATRKKRRRKKKEEEKFRKKWEEAFSFEEEILCSIHFSFLLLLLLPLLLRMAQCPFPSLPLCPLHQRNNFPCRDYQFSSPPFSPFSARAWSYFFWPPVPPTLPPKIEYSPFLFPQSCTLAAHYY